MNALVVGGNGFIGSHLVDHLASNGDQVVVLDQQDRKFGPLPANVTFLRGGLANRELLEQGLSGVDVVFHLAWSTIHETSNRDPAGDVVGNLVPSLQLIDACRIQPGVRLVFLSSGGTVYGPPRSLPVEETHPTEPISSYGITKLAVEKYLQMYQHLHGLDYVVLRPSVPYGPRQNPRARQGAVAVFLHQVATGDPITIWGDGTTTRDFFYIQDLVEAIERAGKATLGLDRIFNLGGGREISLMELIREVEKVHGLQAEIEYRPARAHDVSRLLLDIRRAERDLDWRPQVDLQDGLQRTWRWMQSAVLDTVSERAGGGS